jgi:hypothetical protein
MISPQQKMKTISRKRIRRRSPGSGGSGGSGHGGQPQDGPNSPLHFIEPLGLFQARGSAFRLVPRVRVDILFG